MRGLFLQQLRGELRKLFDRPISRLLLMKYTAVSLYTFSFVFFVGISGHAMAVAAVGWEGGLFTMEPQLSWPKIIVSYAFLFGLNITLFTLGGLSFQTRDFKT